MKRYIRSTTLSNSELYVDTNRLQLDEFADSDEVVNLIQEIADGVAQLVRKYPDTPYYISASGPIEGHWGPDFLAIHIEVEGISSYLIDKPLNISSLFIHLSESDEGYTLERYDDKITAFLSTEAPAAVKKLHNLDKWSKDMSATVLNNVSSDVQDAFALNVNYLERMCKSSKDVDDLIDWIDVDYIDNRRLQKQYSEYTAASLRSEFSLIIDYIQQNNMSLADIAKFARVCSKQRHAVRR